MEAWLHGQGNSQTINLIFAQNDRMAVGARKALVTSRHDANKPLFTGIDGLPNRYNVQGQRVDAVYRGIVIENGKKVFRR